MKKLKIIGLTTLGLTLLLSLTVLGKHRASGAKNPYRLGIEIATDTSQKPLYIPVGLTADKSPIAYVPVENGGYISAVRVAPVMEDGKLKLDVSVVSGDYHSGKCDELKKLPSRLLETRLANKDETVTMQDELSGGPWRVSIKAVELRPPVVIGRQDRGTNFKVSSFQEPGILLDESAAPCGCASCGRENPLLCCPNRGQCLGCSSCGTVCCPAG